MNYHAFIGIILVFLGFIPWCFGVEGTSMKNILLISLAVVCCFGGVMLMTL